MIDWTQETEEKTYWEASKLTSDHQLVWQARIEHDENDSWTWWVSVGDCVAEGAVPDGDPVRVSPYDEQQTEPDDFETVDSGFLLCQALVTMIVERILAGHSERKAEDGEVPAYTINVGDEVEMEDGWMTVEKKESRPGLRTQLTFKEGGGHTLVPGETLFKVRRPGQS